MASSTIATQSVNVAGGFAGGAHGPSTYPKHAIPLTYQGAQQSLISVQSLEPQTRCMKQVMEAGNHHGPGPAPCVELKQAEQTHQLNRHFEQHMDVVDNGEASATTVTDPWTRRSITDAHMQQGHTQQQHIPMDTLPGSLSTEGGSKNQHAVQTRDPKIPMHIAMVWPLG